MWVVHVSQHEFCLAVVDAVNVHAMREYGAWERIGDARIKCPVSWCWSDIFSVEPTVLQRNVGGKSSFGMRARLFFFGWNISFISVAETFWSLKHFGHLSHSCIKTRHSSVHSPLFSDILTDMTKFFFGHFNFGLRPKKNRSSQKRWRNYIGSAARQAAASGPSKIF